MRSVVAARTLTEPQALLPKPLQTNANTADTSGHDTTAFRESLIARGLITPRKRVFVIERVTSKNDPIPRVKFTPSESKSDGAYKERASNTALLAANTFAKPQPSQKAKNSKLSRRERYQQQKELIAQRRTPGLTRTASGLPLRIVVQEPIVEVSAKAVIRCALCNASVYEAAMERHLTSCHPEKKEASLPNVSGSQFPFVLLPPGHWEFQTVFDHYRKKSSSASFDQELDWKRIEQIKLLKPILRHVGVKAWLGYAVYEFPYSNRIVLETPIKGNATYVLSGDWQKMIYRSKAELRLEYVDRYTKVVHRGQWIQRVRAAL
jgi:hypothetical protein